MFFAFCGPPSAHSIFASRLGVEILRSAFGDFQLVYANESTKLVEMLKSRAGRPCLLYFDFPDKVVSQQMVRKGIPTVLVSESFHDIVYYVMAAWNMDLAGAIRFAVQSAVALYPISSSPNIKPIRIAGKHEDLAHFINTIALPLGLQVTDDNIRAIKAHYATATGSEESDVPSIIRSCVEHAGNVEEQRAKLSPEDMAILDRMAKNYQPLFDGEPVTEMIWPAGFCISGDKPHGPASGYMSMTGPARILTFGPYLHLSSGKWRADMRFSVRNNLSGNIIMVDVIAGGVVLAAGRAELPVDGRFAVSLLFEVTQPELPLEVRSIMLAGAIEGEFQLLDIVIANVDETAEAAFVVPAGRVGKAAPG